jgi:hypothetical protein
MFRGAHGYAPLETTADRFDPQTSATGLMCGRSELRVFLTGGSGFVGSAIVRALLKHGHAIYGLARSGPTAEQLRQLGVEPLRGELQDEDSLRQGVVSSDALIHAGFARGASEQLEQAIAVEQSAVRTMLHALNGTDKPCCFLTAICQSSTWQPPRADRDLEPPFCALGYPVPQSPGLWYRPPASLVHTPITVRGWTAVAHGEYSD